MDKFARSLDEQIHRAMEEGQFDNLPGKGKPLRLQHNPHEDPSWRMAYNILRSNGYTLPWIETRQAIESEFEAATDSLTRSWIWRKAVLKQNLPDALVEDEWQRALVKFKEIIKDLNERIFNYNLEVPSTQLQRRKINLEQEIEKITGQVD